jgi:hypothetical protein
MYYVAGLLAIPAVLFYAAGAHELGSAGADMCLLVSAGLATAWAAFVSIR